VVFAVLLCSIVGGGEKSKGGRKIARLIVPAGLILVAMGTLTWKQSAVYENEEIFNRHIVETNPKAINAHGNLGNAYVRKQKWDEAVEAFKEAVKLHDLSPQHANNYAIALRMTNQLEDALFYIQKGLAVDPTRRTAMNELGNIQCDLKQYEEAKETYRNLLQLHSDYAIGWNNYGNIFLQTGEYEEGVNPLKQAIALRPGYLKARLNLIRCLGLLRRREEEIEQLKEYLAIDPGNVNVRTRYDYLIENV